MPVKAKHVAKHVSTYEITKILLKILRVHQMFEPESKYVSTYEHRDTFIFTTYITNIESNDVFLYLELQINYVVLILKNSLY